MHIQLIAQTLLLALAGSHAAPNPQPLPGKDSTSAPAAATGTISAVGIGVASLTASQNFYNRIMGFSRGTSMSFATWDEIIMNPTGGGPAIIPMSFKVSSTQPARSTKDLPVKLQFNCVDAKALQAKIIAGGGQAVTQPDASKTGAKEGTLYAKDPDGYLLELVPGGTATGLAGVGYGSSNLTQSAGFWSRLAGTSAGEVVKTESWDVLTVPTKKKMSMQFLDFRDQRPTKKLPLKIVWAVSSLGGFKSTIKDGGGTVVSAAQVGVLSGFVGMANDPVDQILIEING